MKAELIDLKDYRQSGEGANGASYDSITNPDVMVKLYNADYPLQPIYDELEVARKVFALGISSPEPGELVTDGKRIGIRFRRIRGKRSFSRILADEPERTEEFAREMARLSKRLHSVKCPDGMFPDAKQQFRDMLSQITSMTPEEVRFTLSLIDSMPDADTVLHGDLHFGNIITTLPSGAPLSDPHETYFIDLGYFAKGHPMIDLGMLTGVCTISSEEFVLHDMHITRAQASEFYGYFLDEYFYAPEDRIADKWFGPGETIDSIRKRLRRSYCVKAVLITFNLGFILPETRAVLQSLMAEEG